MRHEPGRLALLAALSAACVLGASLSWWAADRVQVRIDLRAPQAGSARAVELEPSLAARSCATRSELAPPQCEPAVVAEPVLDRAGKARRELAALLALEPFDRPAFERAAMALAAPLTQAELLVLRSAPEEEGLPERLARLELLAARDSGAGTLTPVERALLTSQLAREPASLAESSARLLARLGDARDRATLVAGLDDAEASVRARCLRALLPLARVPELRAELALLAGPGPASSEREALHARLATPAIVRTPHETFFSPAASATERLDAAAQLLRVESAVPEARALLIAALEDRAPATRRRALLALAAAPEGDDLARIVELARQDPDPATRCAAVRALRPGDRACLEEIARHDLAREVRALAAQRALRRE